MKVPVVVRVRRLLCVIRTLIRYQSYSIGKRINKVGGGRQKDKWQVQGVCLSIYWSPCLCECLCVRKDSTNIQSQYVSYYVSGRDDRKGKQNSRRMRK